MEGTDSKRSDEPYQPGDVFALRAIKTGAGYRTGGGKAKDQVAPWTSAELRAAWEELEQTVAAVKDQKDEVEMLIQEGLPLTSPRYVELMRRGGDLAGAMFAALSRVRSAKGQLEGKNG